MTPTDSRPGTEQGEGRAPGRAPRKPPNQPVTGESPATERTTPDYLTWARLAARYYHRGQVDKIGEPYIGHPARVAAAVREATGSDEAEAVAWLHDVIEDTDLSLSALRLAVPASVANAVDAITKRDGEKFSAYYERVKANPLALVVKWHDVADNADPRRLAKVAPDTRERLREKYERAKSALRASLPTAPEARDA